MILNDLKERNYQTVIKDYLINQNNYTNGENRNYDRYFAIDKKMLFDFLVNTQPKEVEKLKTIYKTSFEDKFISRIDSEISKRGLLDVLKNGVKDQGCKITLMYRKPATTINKDLVELYNKNIFSVTEELVYKENTDKDKGGRVDLVIFLNGFPIITFELKCNLSGQTYKNAIKQYMTDRSPKDKLFKFNERGIVHFAMDTEEVYMTTKLEGQDTFFLPFNQGNNGGKGNPFVEGDIRVHYMWEDILQKDTLLYLIDKFIYVDIKKEKDDKNKVVSKIKVVFPRYHQIDAIRKVLNNVYENKTSYNYLIQHSAGSGKTNTIAWLAHRLMSLHDNTDTPIFDGVLVITDRTVVDKQLQEAILALEHKDGTIKIIDDDSSQLANAISSNTKIIVSTIQKFRFILDKLGVLKDKKFAIIIDEAHSSTSGKNMEAVTSSLTMDEARELDNELSEKDLEDEIIEEISSRGKQNNISMFAFTATPKPSTLELFGTFNDQKGKYEAFHLYSMKQAIEEGFILNVLNNYITYDTFYKVSKLVEDDPNVAKSKGKKSIARYAEIHPTNISQKVEIIVEHFKNHVMDKINGKAKGMVVTSSRLAAVKYRMAFDKYIHEKGYKGIKSLVAFTGTIKIDGFDKEFTENNMNGIKEDELPRKFASDEYQVLLVADKYQTGFDQPLLSAMYVDKKLKGVKAVQTLSRLNRVCKFKDQTFILDFKNKVEDIREAFAPFYESTELTDGLDPNMIYDLERKIDDCKILDEEDIQNFIKKVYKEHKTNKDRQIQYSYISNALEKINKLNNLEKLDFKNMSKRLVNLYSLIIQVSNFEDIELHKKYVFLKHLVRAIDIEGFEDIDLSDKISIENFRQVKNEVSNIEVESNSEVSFKAVGDGAKPEDTFDSLSHIIKEINEVFGVNLGEGEKLATLQIEQILKTSPDLEKRAKNNDLENFKYPFKNEFTNSIVEGLNRNRSFFEMLLTNETLGNKLMEHLAERVYNDLKNK